MAEKLYLNIQEQVEKNKKDIQFMLEEEGVLNQFGIKVIGEEADVSDMPSVADYKEDNEDWAYGDAYAIGTEAPYTLYVLTRANGTHPDDYWFNIGQFPKAGPQGETGEQGPAGHTPQVTASVSGTSTLPAGSGATVSISTIGTVDPHLYFSFGIPRGDKGDTGATGRPGAFHIDGQVASAALLPDASLVDADAAYAVGSVLPYDVYVIMTVEGVQSWLNIGPVLTEISDTYDLGIAAGITSGTLSQEQYDALVNDSNMNFIKVGSMLFVKNKDISSNTVTYFSFSMESTAVIFYAVVINPDKSWSLRYNQVLDTPQNYVDLASAQTISGVKTFSNGLKIDWIKDTSGNNRIKVDGPVVFNAAIRADANNNRDLGTSSYKWKDLYLAGYIKGIATLTQAQYDALVSGGTVDSDTLYLIEE